MANRKRDAGREALEKKRLVAQSPLVSVTSPLSVLRAGDVFERSVVWCVDLARQLQQ
ncbi:Uncharacterised protein [Escherichia coli]|uniref:Uncharacterized protein n=1 Tax=Escherichia coli TaxID=562 RepID=A0A376D779_ECOLX|nr:Uncharacterised protein [Escherichia coli]STJ19648.1 Uncharacterised protein [Escherichia coli]